MLDILFRAINILTFIWYLNNFFIIKKFIFSACIYFSLTIYLGYILSIGYDLIINLLVLSSFAIIFIKSRIVDKLFVVAFYCSISFIIEVFLSYIAFLIIQNLNIKDIGAFFPILLYLITKIIFIIIILIIKKKKKSGLTLERRVSPIDYLSLIIPIILAFILLEVKFVNSRLSPNLELIYAVSILGAIFYLSAYIFIKNISIRSFEHFATEFSEFKANKDDNIYIKKRDKLYHDFNKHINFIRYSLDKNNIEDIRTYIRDISSNDDSLESLSTGYTILDMIICSKKRELKDKGIKLKLKVLTDLSETSLSLYEQNVLLGNLFYNCIDHIASVDEKLIFISIININKGHIMIEFRNNFNPNNTTKSEYNLGYGTKIIDEIVNRHGFSIERIISPKNDFLASDYFIVRIYL